MAIRATYKGDGSEYLAGIPARNLDEDDYQALDTEQRKAVRDSSLYDYKTDKEMHAESAPAAAPAAPAAPTKAQDTVTRAAGEGK